MPRGLTCSAIVNGDTRFGRRESYRHADELQRRLEGAIDQLDDDDREIIVMRHFEQLSNQDVAAALELTEAAASMRYLRAVRRLRSLLSPG